MVTASTSQRLDLPVSQRDEHDLLSPEERLARYDAEVAKIQIKDAEKRLRIEEARQMREIGRHRYH